MAADKYYKNDFIFKTITLARIVAGVALTLAVLFAMVWLIDYSSIGTPAPQSQRTLLFPGRSAVQEPRQPQTFFETLLNKLSARNADIAQPEKSAPEPTPRPGRPELQAALKRPPDSQPVARPDSQPLAGTDSQPVNGSKLQITGSSPAPQPAVSRPEPATPSAAVGLFAVQLGSFQQAERAALLADSLVAKGYQPYINKSVLPDGKAAYRVRVGRFVTREEAKDMASRIQSTEKISAFVTSN